MAYKDDGDINETRVVDGREIQRRAREVPEVGRRSSKRVVEETSRTRPSLFPRVQPPSPPSFQVQPT